MPFNEATGFRDVSSRNRNPGAYGNVAISTAQSKYYGSSASFDGGGDYIGISSTRDIVFGLGDFTIEGWFYLNGTGQQHIFENRGGTNTNTILINIDSSTQLAAFLNGSYRITGSALSTGTWYHFAFVRNGGTSTLYQNGNSLGTYADSINYAAPQGGNAYIGVDDGPSGSYLNGHLQDLRIYKGLAKYTGTFTPPERIAEIGVGFKAGQLRYNTDSNKVELYDGSQWAEVQSSRPDLNGGARGLFGGGNNGPSELNAIDFVTIATTGNAQDFGDLITTRSNNFSFSSSTRGIFGGGFSSIPTKTNTIDYVTISSTGNAISFGTLNDQVHALSGCSNSTRGVFGGGISTVFLNVIEYVTIATTGNAIDFGDLFQPRMVGSAAASPIRGLFSGGYAPGASVNTIDFIAISTLGNAQDFGDLSVLSSFNAGCSNQVRAVFAAGATPTRHSTISYVTISTTGNSINFGNITTATNQISGCSSSIRGIFGGGQAPTITNVIEYVTLMSQGNAVDFGDLTSAKTTNSGACSNAHGGL